MKSSTLAPQLFRVLGKVYFIVKFHTALPPTSQTRMLKCRRQTNVARSPDVHTDLPSS
jgi:hypothetical protein